MREVHHRSSNNSLHRTQDDKRHRLVMVVGNGTTMDRSTGSSVHVRIIRTGGRYTQDALKLGRFMPTGNKPHQYHVHTVLVGLCVEV